MNFRCALSRYCRASPIVPRVPDRFKATITVEDATKGIVTRSANDAAVVIAEAIAGSEREFAALMTHKVQTLGMLNTVYINASGLPTDAQITTAREQALLGRATLERFPEYYRYFAIPSFQYHGVAISNHNALLREMQRVDGIKTGYTEASGYNLVSSVRRDGRHLIGVVLGERSNCARDARMRQ
jgi:D-alanyl-D-alanine carboxypeptidase